MPPVCNFLPSGFGCLASARRCSGGSVVSWIKHHVGAEFKIRTSSRSSSSPLSDGWALLLQGMSAPKCSPPCCLRERRRFWHCSPFSPRGWQIMPESFWCSVALVTSLPRSLLHLLMGKWGWPGSGPSFPILVAGGVLRKGLWCRTAATRTRRWGCTRGCSAGCPPARDSSWSLDVPSHL